MARKAPFKLKQLWESRFPPRIPAVSFYAYYTTEIIKDNSKFLMQIDSYCLLADRYLLVSWLASELVN